MCDFTMNGNTKITENFRYGELYLDNPINKPTTEEVFCNLLCGVYTILQPIRNKFGRVLITSGHRCLEYNRSIGSDDTSQHVKGEAYDIRVLDADLKEVYLWIIHNLEYDQVIYETKNGVSWIHVSFKRLAKNRKNNMIMRKGEYFYYNGQNLD